MSAAHEIISALVAGGMDAVEAASLVARAAVEMTAGGGKTSNAVRQQRYRDRNKTVTNRNAVTPESSVTNRNETVTNRNEVTPPLSIDNNKKEKKERGAQIPDGWRPDDKRWQAACLAFGPDSADLELRKFTAHHGSKGTVFKNWNLGWDKWAIQAQQWQPKPSVSAGVVNPEAVNWRAVLQSYKNFGNWPKGHGNDPTSPSCRAPSELLREYGFHQ